MLAEAPPAYLTIILVALVFFGLIGFIFYLNWTDRGRVRRLIESDGSRVLELWPREGPVWVRILNQQAVTHWVVLYVTRTGERRKAICTAMMLRCFVESDEPAPKAKPDTPDKRDNPAPPK